MKKFLAWLLLGAMLLSLCGCAETPELIQSTQAQTEAIVTEIPVAETEPEKETTTEPEILEGSLFLKVSSITFSLVGESEDIYMGMIPRELVTWESEDPNIVSVENGVLTASGVGTTTIRASYADRWIECEAGCLAQTEEELFALDYEILTLPKRLPPDIDLTEPCTYFDNAAIVGDSITYIMSQRESKTNYLGNIIFLARGGVSMNGFVRRYKNIFFRGREMFLEDAIAKSQVERVYFLLGSNDVTSSGNRVQLFDNWKIMLDRIRTLHPTVEIVIFSNIPQYGDNVYYDDANTLIAEYNGKMQQFALENDCRFLDLSYYITDHYGRMPKPYSQDHYHLNEAGCCAWVQMMRFYAQYEAEGGTLS